MKKNLVAIETATILVLIGVLIAGIILKIFTLILLPICLLMIGGIGIAIYKIIELRKDLSSKNDSENSNNNGKNSIFSNPKNAWEFSTIGEKTKSVAFILTFTACCIAFMILCMYGHIKAGIITILVGIAIIVLAIIIMALIEKYLFNKSKREKLDKTKLNDNEIENIDNKSSDINQEIESNSSLEENNNETK